MAGPSYKWYGAYHFEETIMTTGRHERVELSGDAASGRDSEGSSLVPMLAAGLVLVVIGAIVVMAFV